MRKLIGQTLLTLLLFGVLGLPIMATPVCAQDLPRVVPQEVLLRVDATSLGDEDYVRLYLQCGEFLRPLTWVQGAEVTDRQLPLVQLCSQGHLVLETRAYYSVIPLEGVVRLDHAGELGGVLVCTEQGRSALVAWAPGAFVPFTCADLDWHP